MHDIPEGYTEQLTACEWLCYISPQMRRVGADHLRDYLRRWFDAGWTPRDVVYALDHHPTGGLQSGDTPAYNADPQVTLGWMRRRLREWLDDDGEPLHAVHLLIQENRTRILISQADARRQWRQRATAAVSPQDSPGAAAARRVSALT